MRPPQNCHCGRKMVCLSIVPPWDIWGCPNDCKPGSDKSCDDDWETQEVRDPTPNFATIKVIKSGGGGGGGVGAFIPRTPKPLACTHCGGGRLVRVFGGATGCIGCGRIVP